MLQYQNLNILREDYYTRDLCIKLHPSFTKFFHPSSLTQFFQFYLLILDLHKILSVLLGLLQTFRLPFLYFLSLKQIHHFQHQIHPHQINLFSFFLHNHLQIIHFPHLHLNHSQKFLNFHLKFPLHILTYRNLLLLNLPAISNLLLLHLILLDPLILNPNPHPHPDLHLNFPILLIHQNFLLIFQLHLLHYFQNFHLLLNLFYFMINYTLKCLFRIYH